MAHDVDDIAVGRADEEAANAPRLIGERVHDLVAAALRFCVCLVDVVTDVYGHDRVVRSGGISAHQLDVCSTIWRLEVGDPSEVESFDLQSEVVAVERLR